MLVQWRPVANFEGRYEVSSDGFVRSLRGSRYEWDPPRQLKQHVSTTGYLQVVLTKKRRKTCTQVHRLVAAAFIRAPKNGEHVRHLNGNPRNNDISNLAVGTVAENASDRDRHGRTARGVRNGNAKLSKTQVDKIKRSYLSGKFCQKQLAALFNIGQSHVSRIIRGESRGRE